MQSDTNDCAADALVRWWESHWRSVVYSFLAGIIFTLACSMCSAASAADYQKPPGAPELALADGRTVSVFAVQTAVGHGIGVLEKTPAALWYLCGTFIIDAQMPDLNSAVANAGGATPYVESKRPQINALLAARYPAVGPQPQMTLGAINGVIATNMLRVVNGVPVLAAQ